MDFPCWDPVLFDIPGLPIDIRWYGLMYVVGFVCGQWILVKLAKERFWPVTAQQAADLVVYLVLGVMLGGRVGYALFYDQGLVDPIKILKVWEGGLSFHGGLAGVGIASWLYARKVKAPWTKIVDACALAVTPGVFAVRIANFINGELYGRVTQKGVGWAMQFPTDPRAQDLMHLSDAWTMRDRELCIQYAFRRVSWEDVEGKLSTVDAGGRPIDWERIKPFLDWEAIRDQVPFRHPSQLYEGIGEGLVLGLVIFAVYWVTRRRPLPYGWYAALFLFGYSAARISIELVRQPDPQFGPTGNVFLDLMTMGQTLSTLMVVGGVLILVLSRRRDPAPGAGGPAAG
jgi:phosphatidylglycerol---prolipoprotein diacylglyceryl transferase